MNTIKTAIAIPKQDFIVVEKLRKKLHKTRSQILVEAFREWVEKRRAQKLDDQYAEAYRKQPEDAAELHAMLQGTASTWPKEDW
jgi:hypothetical protein